MWHGQAAVCRGLPVTMSPLSFATGKPPRVAACPCHPDFESAHYPASLLKQHRPSGKALGGYNHVLARSEFFMADKSDKDKKKARRSFFRQLFIRGLDKAEEAGKKIAKQVGAFVEPPQPAYVPPTYESHSSYRSWDSTALRILRPPGAARPPMFAETCTQCGECVTACPARAIKLDENTADHLPYIIARQSPCVVCNDLSCMKACPTGALKLVESREQIQMGYAITDMSRCLRGGGFAIYDEPTSITGEDCQLCVTQCPIGKEAIAVDHHGCIEVRHGCIGCGVCEQVCPTEGPSIWVEPW